MRALLGIDLGTSSLKALLLREDGWVLGSCGREYPILIPSAGWAEQDPLAWWQAAASAIRELLSQTGTAPSEIAGVGLSGQMHGMVPLDAALSPLRPAIIWADQRARAQVDEVLRVVGKEAFGRITLNPLFPGAQLATLLWMRDREPERFRQIAHVVSPKDYVRLRLTGEVGTEVSDASSTLLFDTAQRRWSAQLLDALGLDAARFPEPSESLDVAGAITPTAAAETGLAVGTPVIAGGSDQPMQAFGNGLTAPGTLSVTVGTGGQLFSIVDRPIHDPAQSTHTFCGVLPGTWYVMGATLSAGLSLRWFAESLAPGCSFDSLAAEAAAAPPGSEGLVFLPYLVGERTPHMDPDARAAFLGLSLKHGRGHLVRAVMEGVAYSLRDCLDVLEGLGIRADRVIGSGGGARSALWLQILSDVLARELRTSGVKEQASCGAALAAGVGAGVFPDVSCACAALLDSAEGVVVRPDPARSEEYARRQPVFRDLYRALRPLEQRVAGTAAP